MLIVAYIENQAAEVSRKEIELPGGEFFMKYKVTNLRVVTMNF